MRLEALSRYLLREGQKPLTRAGALYRREVALVMLRSEIGGNDLDAHSYESNPVRWRALKQWFKEHWNEVLAELEAEVRKGN